MHDPLNLFDLVHDELRQRAESGYVVDEAADRLAGVADDDRAGLESVYRELGQGQRRRDWGYHEPDTLREILDAMPAATYPTTVSGAPVLGSDQLSDRVLGGWLGRIAGCNLGKPVENGDLWPPELIRSYLEQAGAYPLRDYIPASDPPAEGYPLRECWRETTRGRIHGSARDDDIDYSILALSLLERRGLDLSIADVAEAMLANLPYLRVFTAERAAIVNLLREVPVESVGQTRNPYREWIGALIRADVYGWAFPGRPDLAVRLAFIDASLTHRANGIYGAIWAAALVSLACVARSVRAAFTASLAWVPERSRLAEALRWVQAEHAAGRTWEETLDAIRHRYGHYSWVHTVNNACLIAAGLLWGEQDFATTVGLTVQGGWDTDSNAATAGSVTGTVLGARTLPPHFIEPLQDRTRSAVFGYDNSRISTLAERTTRLACSGVGSGRTS